MSRNSNNARNARGVVRLLTKAIDTVNNCVSIIDDSNTTLTANEVIFIQAALNERKQEMVAEAVANGGLDQVTAATGKSQFIPAFDFSLGYLDSVQITYSKLFDIESLLAAEDDTYSKSVITGATKPIVAIKALQVASEKYDKIKERLIKIGYF